MMSSADLPDVIPIFPLTGVLLLPRARLPLHLFEPRYLVMLEDVLKTPQRLIGMIQPLSPAARGRTDLQMTGCAGRVSQFSETEDGRYMITLAGVSRFRLIEEIQGFTPYRRARVCWAGFEQDQQPKQAGPGLDRDAFLAVLAQYFAMQDMQADWDSLKQADDELLINSLSMLLGFAPEDKQALLEAPSLNARCQTLMTLIEFAIRGGDEEILQ